jgi:hypothetical protein
MNRLHVFVLLFTGFACSGLKAQTTIMEANIPFDFQLGKSAMPAGEYRINYSQGILMVRSKDTHHSAIVLTRPESREKATDTGLLQFTRYGDTYFLAGVWAPNSANGGALNKTSREKELASRAVPAKPATIALSANR